MFSSFYSCGKVRSFENGKMTIHGMKKKPLREMEFKKKWHTGLKGESHGLSTHDKSLWNKSAT